MVRATTLRVWMNSLRGETKDELRGREQMRGSYYLRTHGVAADQSVWQHPRFPNSCAYHMNL